MPFVDFNGILHAAMYCLSVAWQRAQLFQELACYVIIVCVFTMFTKNCYCYETGYRNTKFYNFHYIRR